LVFQCVLDYSFQAYSMQVTWGRQETHTEL
jgi:hypothetical protein